MFERWTDRARRSVVLAQENARMMNHPEMGTGHLVLGLIGEGGGVAYRALAALGADLDATREALARSQPRGRDAPLGHIPFSARVKRTCELALREALNLGHTYIGTEHILLGLVREGEETGVSVLVALGISPDDARAKVMELLGGYEKADAPRFAHLPLPDLLDAVRVVDAHIDASTAPAYRDQPLAADWARVTKVCEEAGEVWRALSKMTGENPRKGVCGTRDDLLGELGDTVSAAMCAIQHLTKDTDQTWAVVSAALIKARQRVGEVPADGN